MGRPGRCGLLLGSWHSFRGDNSVDQLASIPADRIVDRIVAVQPADGPTTPADDLSTDSMQARLLPGTGDRPLSDWLRSVRGTGAEPGVGPEVFSGALPAAPPATPPGQPATRPAPSSLRRLSRRPERTAAAAGSTAASSGR